VGFEAVLLEPHYEICPNDPGILKPLLSAPARGSCETGSS
jgi:hypothetical protein